MPEIFDRKLPRLLSRVKYDCVDINFHKRLISDSKSYPFGFISYASTLFHQRKSNDQILIISLGD